MDSTRLETVPAGPVTLDTVRALHQTVVSLRTALEISKNELKQLKHKYEQHSNCIEYADVIEKLTLENHVLRRKIIDSDNVNDSFAEKVKFGVTYGPKSEIIHDTSSDVVIQTATNLESDERIEPEYCGNIILEEQDCEHKSNSNLSSPDKFNETPISASPVNLTESTPRDDAHNTELDLSETTSLPKQENEQIHQPSFKTKLELLSKFDVRIKVRTLKEGVISSSTSDSDSTVTTHRKKESDSNVNFHFEEKREQFERARDPKGNKINYKSVSRDSVKMAVPNEADVKSKTDKFDVQVRITSEENLVVKENIDRSRRNDTLNLDVDDLSLRSLSEGDNSVFSEGGASPPSSRPPPPAADRLEQDASGNESEEVDDIELIFTTDESKDMSNLQEDLVSIRDTDNWAPHSASTTHSTPVLIKFHTLDPDFQPGEETSDNAENENQENATLQNVITESTLKMKRVSLPNDKEIRHVAFNSKGSLDLPGRGILKTSENKSDNALYRKSPNASTRRLDSVDSLTCEYNRGLSFDNTKSSSFELGSSMDILHRDESVDSFHRTGHLGHRFSVFAATDISKCGISEDDLVGNLNVRRNTCPNPFQYRPPPYRSTSRMAAGPFKPAALSASGRLRPVLRDATYPRRENGVQTDVSALPPRWSSDGYLSHKMSATPNTVPTLPQRAGAGVGAGPGLGYGAGAGRAAGRRLAAPDARVSPPARRTDDARRVLLSDIGFTSMVPELSRSADPVWALAKRMPSADDTTPSNSTSKFLSRGSSYRSPCPSIDKSNDWTSHYAIGPPIKVENRVWRNSLPDVRRDDTEELLEETETYLRRSIDNLRSTSLDLEKDMSQASMSGQPYIPAEPRHLRLGHTVKVITPHGRIAVGRVRYVGIAGGSVAGGGGGGVVVGAEFPRAQLPALPRNDGTHRARRYFLAAPHCTALFVPFAKVVMAWAT